MYRKHLSLKMQTLFLVDFAKIPVCLNSCAGVANAAKQFSQLRTFMALTDRFKTLRTAGSNVWKF